MAVDPIAAPKRPLVLNRLEGICRPLLSLGLDGRDAVVAIGLGPFFFRTAVTSAGTVFSHCVYKARTSDQGYNHTMKMEASGVFEQRRRPPQTTDEIDRVALRGHLILELFSRACRYAAAAAIPETVALRHR